MREGAEEGGWAAGGEGVEFGVGSRGGAAAGAVEQVLDSCWGRLDKDEGQRDWLRRRAKGRLSEQGSTGSSGAGWQE